MAFHDQNNNHTNGEVSKKPKLSFSAITNTEIQSEFSHHDPTVARLNNGAFGCCPSSVLAAQRQWQLKSLRQPDHFYFNHLQKGILHSRTIIKDLVNAQHVNEISIVDNASTATAIVLQQASWAFQEGKFNKGDSVVMLHYAYGSVKKAIEAYVTRAGGRVIEVPLTFPVTSEDDIIREFRHVLEKTKSEGSSNKVRLAVIDHVTSMPSMVIPVKELVKICREEGVDQVFVDAAHAVGCTPRVDMQEIGADFYTSNLHKWFFCPPSVAFIYTRKSVNSVDLHHPVVSHEYGNGLAIESSWIGNRDYSAQLVVPTVMEFVNRFEGGIEGIKERNHDCVVEMGEMLVEAWGTHLGTPHHMSASMVMVGLPPSLGIMNECDAMNLRTHLSHQDNMHAQFPHHMFPPWPVHSPPGTVPVYPPYPVQGIPYYQPYPGNSPYMQPNYPPMDDPRLTPGQNMGLRRHSMDSRHSNTGSETCDVEASKSRLHDEVDMEREGSQTGDRRKKGSRSGRQKSGMVVIRNINYITKTEKSSGSGSYSDSVSETDEDIDEQEHAKTSKRRGSRKESLKKLSSSDKEETDHVKDADGGHWQAFQNCLLRDVDEDRHAIDQDQYGMEKVHDRRRNKHVSVNDPLVLNDREMHEVQGSRTIDDAQSLEVHGRSSGSRKAVSDDFILRKQESQSGNSYPSSDLEITGSGQGYSNDNLQRKLFHDMNDDSYMLEHRSIQVNDAGNAERHMIDIDSEFPMVRQEDEKTSNGIDRMNNQLDELSMMPVRGAEGGSMSYDPALDYEMQAQAGGALQGKNKEVLADAKPGSKRLDKEPKSKLTPNSSDKRKSVGPIRRGKISKLSPLEEARARAESLRNYKADLQKMKKEKEEEAIKRIETLKMERQKRIAAKSSSVTTQSPVASHATKRQVPSKFSPSSHKGSKFSDSEPGPSSPLQRFPARTASVGSVDSLKSSKTSRLSIRSPLNDNKLSQSVSSLPESKLEKDDSATNTKVSMARIRRLSEPKMSSVRQTSSVKPLGAGTKSKTKASDGPESKKISAIVNHDKSKIAALPELKVRTSKASETVQNVSSAKVKTQKLNDNKSSMNSEGTILKKSKTGISSSKDDGDDNPVIEKTVVMLEDEKPYAPAIYAPKKEYDSDKMTEKTETSSNYVAIRAPVSPLSMDTLEKGTSESQSHLQPISTEVKMDNTGKEPSKSSSNCIAEETYHAPYARVSSMEDPSTRNSEYGKAAPTSLETAAIGADTGKARVSDIRNSTLEKIPETTEKPHAKESPKGFRRLLKFGKKGHSSATRNAESDNVSIDGSEADEVGTNGSSNEVHTLKNLISQDETPTASTTQQKSSRSFSLLSPFRKNSEKR